MKVFKNEVINLMIIFGLALTWLVASIFIDFIAAPSIFRTVSSLKEAGTLGAIVFSSFNTIELIVAIALITLSFLVFKKSKLNKVICGLGATCLVLAVVYSQILTPGIKESNINKSKYDETSEQYTASQAKLDSYHSLYVKLDSYKMLVLIAICLLSLKRVSTITRIEDRG